MPTVALIGQSAVAYAGNLRIFSSDWHSFYFEQHQIVDSSATALQALTGQSSNAAYGEIAESGAGFNELTGIESVSSVGTAVFSGTESAIVLLSGIENASSASNVSAYVLNPEVWSSGQIKRYPANAFKNSSIQIDGLNTYASIGDISATGSIHINATAIIDNVVSFAQVESISADGILSISEDELIMLLAA